MAKKRKKGSGSGQKVGRGYPPKHTQFQKGQSGNKKGRPKGSKNLSTYIMEAARDHVTATVGGRTRKISKIQATAMQLATKAASGHPASISEFLDWVDEIESRDAAARPTQFSLSPPDVVVLRETYERMKECDLDTFED